MALNIAPGVLAASLALAAILGATTTCAADWTLDAGSSALRFTATFEGAPAPGRFGRFGVTMRFDPGSATDGNLVVTIDPASADMGNDDINREIRGVDWFDVARYPVAEFRSVRIERSGPTRFVASGTLTLRGMARPLDLSFDWEPSPEGAAMTGAVTIDRGAFGIGSGEWRSTRQVGGMVNVEFSVRLRRSG